MPKYNIIRQDIISLGKTKPHFLQKETWKSVKIINEQIATLCQDKFLHNSEITWTAFIIKTILDDIAETAPYEQLYEANTWTIQIIDFYLKISTEVECYETADNLLKLKNYIKDELSFIF